MPEHPFSSKEEFYQTYVAGLERLLDQADVGTFILVQANASMHPDIMARLEEPLRIRFHSLADRCRELFRQGRIPREISDEDLLVFLKLLSIGFDEVEAIDNRVVDDWEIYFTTIKQFAADVIHRIDTVAANPAFQKCEAILLEEEKIEVLLKRLRGEMSLVEIEVDGALEQIETSKKKQKGE